MYKKVKFFTTSWDDGSQYDMKLANLLAKYDIKGTFYIPIRNAERDDTLHPEHIREISKVFEIGNHTYSHITLTDIKDEVAEMEISDGKKALEDIIGKQIITFCPPKGKFKKKHIKHAEKSGALLFRTTGYLRMEKIIDKTSDSQINLLHTTAQFYPHKYIALMLSAFKRGDLEGSKHILKYIKNLKWNWYGFLKHLLEKNFNVFHLWGHSWEIEKYGLWGKLEDTLRCLKDSSKFYFLTNSEVLKEYDR